MISIKSKKYWIFAAITFVIVFLMNYIDNESPDKLSSALMNASAGIVGLTIGVWFLYKNKDDDHPQEFD